MGDRTTTAYIVGCQGEFLGVFATEDAAARHQFEAVDKRGGTTCWISPVPAFDLYTAAQVAEAVKAEREACLDLCSAEARDDGTAQRIMVAIRERAP